MNEWQSARLHHEPFKGRSKREIRRVSWDPNSDEGWKVR